MNKYGGKIMPFASKAQQRFLYSQKPEVAKKYAKHTPNKQYKKLPERIAGRIGK